MRRRRLRRSIWRQHIRAVLTAVHATLIERPHQVAGMAGAMLVLCWLIATTTLPFALAERSPDTALMLNPNNPVALLTLADRARTKLHELTRLATLRSNPDATAALPDDASEAPPVASIAEQSKALREEIYSLAARALAADPMNAHAYTLLAEVTTEPSQTRALMQEALKRSRHETAAVLWLMIDGHERREFASVTEKADILLRTRPGLSAYVMRYLGNLADIAEGRALLVALLAKHPPWRASFFQLLPKNVALADTPLDLMLALKDAGATPTPKEMAPYLDLLIAKSLPARAYDAWLQFVPEERLASLKLLNNPAFAEDPSGQPFDWRITPGANAIADLVPPGGAGKPRALSYQLSQGRVKFPQASQIVVLAPGRYQFSGEIEGRLEGKRGLRWQFRCLAGKGRMLAETDMIFGQVHGQPVRWQPFSLDVEVPKGEDCEAQQLRLIHDARSASEEMLTGQIAFRNLDLVRAEPGPQAHALSQANP